MRLFAGLFAALFLLTAPAFAAAPADKAEPQKLTILRVTPQGEDVPAAQQIVIEFNRGVVPLGQMDRTDEQVGVTINPPLQCHWRWLNAATLACNLDQAASLKPATAYSLTIDQTIEAEDGGKLAAAYEHRFITERADVSYSNFQVWEGPSSPVIRVSFNQPVGKKSVEAHLFLQNEGKTHRYPLEAKPDKDDTEPASVTASGDDARSAWIVSTLNPLPLDSKISLMIEPGLEAAGGTELSAVAREVIAFQTYPEFAFAGVACTNNQDKQILIAPGTADTVENRCNPMQPASLAFTAPVLRSVVKDNLVTTPSLSGNVKDYNPWGDENRDWSRRDTPHTKDQLYYVGLPVGLKAAQAYTFAFPEQKLNFWQWLLAKWRGTPENKVQDEFSRPLPASVTLTFQTDHRKPNFELVHRDAVLEKGIDSDVPLFVNNLDSATVNYRALTVRDILTGKTKTTAIPEVEDVQFAIPFGVRDMLGGKSGAIYGQLSTVPETNKWEGAGRIFAQITPYQVHAKLGHFQSLVWVTDLTTGQPVQDANVRIVRDTFTTLGSGAKRLAGGRTDAAGLAQLPGLDVLDPQQTLVQSWNDNDERLFVRVDKGADMALLPIANPYFADTWRFYENNVSTYNADQYGHMKAWGMTAQGVYRAGDTIQYKIYLRDQDNRKLVLPPKKGRYSLRITDPTGNVAAKIENVTFSEFGSYAGEYTVPKSAPVGWYSFRIKADFNPPSADTPSDSGASDANSDDDDSEADAEEEARKGVFFLDPMRVLVSDFTPAAFRVTTDLNGDHFRAGDKVTVLSSARMHAGGAYTDASVRVTATLRSRPFTPATPVAQGFTFASFEGEQDSQELFQKQDALNDKGDYESGFEIADPQVVYGRLDVESAVQDDRGKAIAGSASAAFTGVDRLVGLKSPEWVYTKGKPVSIDTLVVDDKGAAIKDVNIKAIIEQDVVTTAKVKGAGNAYLSETTHSWQLAHNCDLISADQPVPCTFTPKGAGTYRITADINDSKGRPHKTALSFWVTGDDYVQWDSDSDFVLPLVPEKAGYNVGETARYLVKNPFPGAQALVTVERYGVLDSFVQKLEGSTPVIAIPVKPDYLPGFYVSVIVLSPRVEAPPAEAGAIDMGKPSFRMGYAGTKVTDSYKDMDVKVKLAQDVYRPGEMAIATIHAAPRHVAQGEAKEPVELAVAVVDEAVFDLITDGRAAYDPYNGFYSLDPLDMRNYTLMNALVGRQKFERKGANPGGDGGVDVNMRSITKFVSYWNPSLRPDASGKVEISFPTPDNLTGWKVLALAVTPTDRMGLGDASFKVNRPTELRPVMPNQIREGDSFEAGLSVMNRTDTKRTIKVELTATGDVGNGTAQKISRDVTLEPRKRRTITLPLTADLLPQGRDGAIHFTAKAGDAVDSDALTHDVPVLTARVFAVGAIYGTTTENSVTQNLVLPEGRAPRSTSLQMSLSPTVLGNLDGAFRYMRDYPYYCWEQRLTKGTMAALYQNLKPYLADSVTWPGSDTLTVETLADAAMHQAPNGGMTYFVATDEHVDPYLSAYTALAFSWLDELGYAIPETVDEKLDSYLEDFLRSDTAPDFYQPGMASDVRAVALHARALRGHAVDLERYGQHIDQMSLFGKAHLMQAAELAGGHAKMVEELRAKIGNAGSETAGKLSFNQAYDDGYARILATPLRDNCAILDAFLQGDETTDKPMRMVRAITQSRGNRDHWENTQENMFCARAMISYAKKYEATAPRLQASVQLNSDEIARTGFASVKDKAHVSTSAIDDATPAKSVLTINRQGQGRLYYTASLRYALEKPPETVNAGIDITREISIETDGTWQLLPRDAKAKRGDIVRVDLYVAVPTARHFVVVNDPLPGGLEAINRDLATSSDVDDAKALYDERGGSFWFKFNDWNEYGASFWNFYHREIRNDSVRFYADYLPPGRYHLSYTAQVIADGTFTMLPTRAEEMYDADIYGLSSAGKLTVQAKAK